MRSCPICNNETNLVFKKIKTDYFLCVNCLAIFSDAIDQEGLVGGEFEIERNQKENDQRIKRIDAVVAGIPKEEVRILDWGCGHGLLIEDLKGAGYVNVDGYDSYNPAFQRLPSKDSYHVVILVEVAEHFSFPFTEIDVIRRCLINHGAVLMETGYLNATREDGILDEENPYINPTAGHSTIYTHHAMDLLMAMKGFYPKSRFNRHCLLYQKLPK